MPIRCKWAHESYKLTLNDIQKSGVIDYEEEFSRLSAEAKPMHCGLNDWAAIQVVIMPDQDYLLSLDGGPAFSPQCKPSLRVQFRVYKIDSRFKFSSRPEILPTAVRGIGCVDSGEGMRCADLLLSGGIIPVNAKEPCALFLSVDVPRDAHPGVYIGEVKLFSSRLFEDEELCAEMSFELNVHTAALPKRDDRVFHLDLWQHVSNISRKHDVPRFGEAHFKILEAYVEALSDIGQQTITLVVSEAPWAGCRHDNDDWRALDVYEYSMVNVTRRFDGSWEYDFKNIESIVKMYHELGIVREIDVFGLIGCRIDEERGFIKLIEGFDENLRVRYFDEKDGSYKYMRYEPEIRAYVYALYDFFDRMRWIENVRIIADEPGEVNEFMKRLEWFKRLCPRMKFKCVTDDLGFIEGTSEEIEDYVLSFEGPISKLYMLANMHDKIRGRLTWHADGFSVWENMELSSYLLKNRLIALLTTVLDFDGFMDCNYTAWPENKNIVGFGCDGRPLLTLRYYVLKRGIDEFEYAQILKCQIGSDALHDIIANALSLSADLSDMNYSLDPESYDTLRRDLILALSKA